MNLSEKELNDYCKEFKKDSKTLLDGVGLSWPKRAKMIGKCLTAIVFLVNEREALLKRIEKLEKSN